METSLRDIIAKNHLEVIERLTRVETEVAASSGLESRVRILEQSRGYITGAATVISVLFSAAIAFIIGLVRKS